MNKKISENRVEEIIREVQGNIKHEDMILTNEEKNLLREYVLGNISRKEYIKKALKM